MINLPAIIGNVVEEAAYRLGTDIAYKHGTWKHIMERLIGENGSVVTNERFPLVALVQVFEEKYRADSEYPEVVLTLLIANLSNRNWYSEERYTNNFIPVLYPIYDKFLEVLAESQYVVGYEQKYLEHTKIDDLYLPEGDANKLPDVLDGVWVRDLRLRLNPDKCPVNYPVINTEFEFTLAIAAPGFPTGIDSYEFDVLFSDTSGLKDGCTFDLNVIPQAGSLAVTTNDSNLTLDQTGNVTTVTVVDASLLSNPLSFTAFATTPPSTIGATGYVFNMTGLRPTWVNETNTQDTITI